jgi:uncharacterized protein with HEPN domain
MLDHAQKALDLVAGRSRAATEAEELRVLALARVLELVGEAATRVPRDLQQRHPDVPWSGIIGLRNVLIHGYDKIDWDQIWMVLSRDLPALVPKLEKMKSALRPPGRSR